MRSPLAGRGGFTLLELLLALGLGLLVCALMVQALVVQGRQGALLVRHLRERGMQQRTIELVRAELLRAVGVRLGSAAGASCGLAGRQPVIQISTAEGPITYSLGTAPSAIWRGRVLMRCGPAFGLDGEPSLGAAQNRVVLDGLTEAGFRAEAFGGGRLRLRLEQEFGLPGGQTHRIQSTKLVAAAALVTP